MSGAASENTSGPATDRMVRVVHGAVAVDSLPSPHHVVHFRIFHPARRSHDDAERMTGQVPPDPNDAPWPVLIFLPGINIGPEGYRWLGIQCAAAGIAMVSMALVGETLPGVVGISPGLDLTAVHPDTYGTRPSGLAIGPLLAALHAEQSGGRLTGLLDLERVALGGHSGGGSVALQNASPEWFPGVSACVTFASHTMASTMLGFDPGSVLAVGGDVPTMVLAGELDGVMAKSADRYAPTAGAVHDPVRRTFDEAVPGGRGDCRYGVVAGAPHTAAIWPRDDTTARGFLDPEAGRPPEDIRDDIGELIVEFLRATLRGDPAAWVRLDAVLDDPARCVDRSTR